MRFLWIALLGGCTLIGGQAHQDQIDALCAADPDQPGCPPVGPGTVVDTDPPTPVLTDCYPDGDGDGHGAGTPVPTEGSCPSGSSELGDDCDDADEDAVPGGTEICGNGVDDDCVGGDATAEQGFTDGDGDGFGVGPALSVCPGTPDTASVDGDCDDTDEDVNPDATEVPADGVDQDCDDAELCPADNDGDGAYTMATLVPGALGCAPVAAQDDDCDDTDPGTLPGAADVLADGLDQDCDGGDLCWADADGDGWGDDTTLMSAVGLDCAADPLVAPLPGDCDDLDPTSNPGEVEDCDDDVDHDCNGDPTGGAWYLDHDGDGFGDPASLVEECVRPDPTYIQIGGDCDDLDEDVNPGATELPADGVDQDCDLGDLCYVDGDGDGFGDGTAPGSLLCDGPGESTTDGDCDDTCATCLPGGTEVCDGLDNDCDQSADEDATDPSPWYPDGDGDLVGAGAPVLACEAPTGHVGIDGDCDDTVDTVYPGAPEVCGNGVDDNCDPTDDASGSNWYADTDGDQQGAGAPLQSCTQPAGYVANANDCDDTSAQVFLGNPAVVVGDGIDQDCDGNQECWPDPDDDGYAADNLQPVPGGPSGCPLNLAVLAGDCLPNDPSVNPGATETAGNGVDEDCDGQRLCYPDTDFDSAGAEGSTPTLVASCTNGYAQRDLDCDDTNPSVNPNGTEVVGDALDQDCNGTWSCRPDADGDTYTTTGIVELTTACPVTTPGDCDDTRPLIYPGAPERCNGRDDDCANGIPADEGDDDADGYSECDWVGASGPIVGGLDCNDTNGAVNPGATESPGNNVDENCDGQWRCYLDGDGDSQGGTQVSQTTQDCTVAGRSTVNTDCDDTRATVFQGAPEVCDGLDNDCNGTIPLNEVDNDNDVYVECAPWTGPGAILGGDCDDNQPAVNPGRLEVCDGLDNDCNPATSEVNRVSIGSSNYNSLQTALGAVTQSNFRINVCGGTHPLFADYPNNAEIVGVGQIPLITRNAAQDRIAQSDGGLSFTNVTIDGGATNYPDDGGCFWFSDGQLQIHDSTVRSCHSTGDGGAVYVSNAATLTVTDTTFTQNTADGSGGAVACDHCDGGDLTSVDFVENLAVGSGGGAWFMGSVLDADDVTFDGNAGSGGGGLAMMREVVGNLTPPDLNATALTFTDNEATNVGGGLLIQYGSQTCMGCVFNGNRSVNAGQAIYSVRAGLTYTNGSVINHTFGVGMPAMAVSQAVFTLTNVQVTNNDVGIDLLAASSGIQATGNWNLSPENGCDVIKSDDTCYNVPVLITGFSCSGTICN